MITKYNNPEKGNLQRRERSLAIWGKFQMDKQAGAGRRYEAAHFHNVCSERSG